MGVPGGPAGSHRCRPSPPEHPERTWVRLRHLRVAAHKAPDSRAVSWARSQHTTALGSNCACRPGPCPRSPATEPRAQGSGRGASGRPSPTTHTDSRLPLPCEDPLLPFVLPCGPGGPAKGISCSSWVLGALVSLDSLGSWSETPTSLGHSVPRPPSSSWLLELSRPPHQCLGPQKCHSPPAPHSCCPSPFSPALFPPLCCAPPTILEGCFLQEAVRPLVRGSTPAAAGL